MTFCSSFVSPLQSHFSAELCNPNKWYWGKCTPPCLLWTCRLVISLDISRPFRSTPMKIHTFLPSLFATSGISTLCYLSTSLSPHPFNLLSHKSTPHMEASLSPCCSSPLATSLWSSNGCIFTCTSHFFRGSMSWQKGNTDGSALHSAHTDICICSHATEGECALQVHSPLMYILLAVWLCSSALCQT